MARSGSIRLIAASLAVWGWSGPVRADSAVCTFDAVTLTQATRAQGTGGTGTWIWGEPVSRVATEERALWRATASFSRGKDVGTLAWTQMVDPLGAGAAIVAVGASTLSVSAVEPSGALHALTVSTVPGHYGRHAAVFVAHTGAAGFLSVAQYRGTCSVAMDTYAAAP